MKFTIEFLELFFFAISLSWPILGFLWIVIVSLGFVAGRKEKWSYSDTFYWSFITATTVGYGDIRPKEKLTRHLSILIAFFGLIFSGLIVAIAVACASHTLREPLIKHLNPDQSIQSNSPENDPSIDQSK